MVLSGVTGRAGTLWDQWFDSPESGVADFGDQPFLGPTLYAEDAEKRNQAYDLVKKARKALTNDPELAQILAELSYQRKEYD